MESSIGRTKHADRFPLFLPALRIQGELGKKVPVVIKSYKSFSKCSSLIETARAILLNIADMVSPGCAYLCNNNFSADLLNIFTTFTIEISLGPFLV